MFLRKRGHVAEAVGGLPDEHGGEEGLWINADPIPGCIVCNIGESKLIGIPERLLTHSRIVWEIWTNGLYKSTLHRVVHRGTNYRYAPSTLPERSLYRVDLFDCQRLVGFDLSCSAVLILFKDSIFL